MINQTIKILKMNDKHYFRHHRYWIVVALDSEAPFHAIPSPFSPLCPTQISEK